MKKKSESKKFTDFKKAVIDRLSKVREQDE